MYYYVYGFRMISLTSCIVYLFILLLLIVYSYLMFFIHSTGVHRNSLNPLLIALVILVHMNNLPFLYMTHTIIIFVLTQTTPPEITVMRITNKGNYNNKKTYLLLVRNFILTVYGFHYLLVKKKKRSQFYTLKSITIQNVIKK